MLYILYVFSFAHQLRNCEMIICHIPIWIYAKWPPWEYILLTVILKLINNNKLICL